MFKIDLPVINYQWFRNADFQSAGTPALAGNLIIPSGVFIIHSSFFILAVMDVYYV